MTGPQAVRTDGGTKSVTTASPLNVLRLPLGHQLAALVRLSPAMSASDLAHHRRQTCLGLLHELDRLEAELEILLASATLEACVDADAIAKTRAALCHLRAQIVRFSQGGASTAPAVDQPLERA